MMSKVNNTFRKKISFNWGKAQIIFPFKYLCFIYKLLQIFILIQLVRPMFINFFKIIFLLVANLTFAQDFNIENNPALVSIIPSNGIFFS